MHCIVKWKYLHPAFHLLFFKWKLDTLLICFLLSIIKTAIYILQDKKFPYYSCKIVNNDEANFQHYWKQEEEIVGSKHDEALEKQYLTAVVNCIVFVKSFTVPMNRGLYCEVIMLKGLLNTTCMWCIVLLICATALY